MYWRNLERFRDNTVPKLNNLRRAAGAGLRVPLTRWAPASDPVPPAAAFPPPELGPGPWIIRSGSPTEDTRTTSNAGQLLSLVVRDRADFGTALRRVLDALPRATNGTSRGAVFVQPLVAAEEAGVAFFDGFYYERTRARGGNEALTSGQARGEVCRGHLARGEPWSAWLYAVHAVFGTAAGGDQRLDLEYARDDAGFILLQVRPALFPLRRNPTLSLANHKEILGDPPSPWIVSALVAAGRDLSFLATADPAIGLWDETYAVEVGERAWLNVSFWYRWMDHFGLPRTLVTEGVGGQADGPEDGRILRGRFLASVPRLLGFQWQCLRVLPGLGRAFRQLDAGIEAARGLAGLHRVTAQGLALALRGNFAINAVLSGVARLRRFLRVPGSARVITQDMMEDYGRLATLAANQREAGLNRWLARYGHRGPLESDLARPRFAELRTTLLQDLLARPEPVSPAASARRSESGLLGSLWRPFYRIDERREWFRDAMMRRWQRLRARILQEAGRFVAAGELDAPEEVFWLREPDLRGTLSLRQAVQASKARVQAVKDVALPLSAPLETIQELLTRTDRVPIEEAGRRTFPGISLGPALVEGRALKAEDLITLLAEAARPGNCLGPDTILVVPTLEPSWAVVFPRVAGVVAEVGGELSHASILLREAGRPAIVNCAGIFRHVQTGDWLRLDGTRGLVEVVGPLASSPASV